MSQIKQHRSATKYVYMGIRVRFDDGTTDPTVLNVEMAFVGSGEDLTVGHWKSASWTEINVGEKYRARCLVGPTGVVNLAPGIYRPFLRFIDDPETDIYESPNTLLVT